MGAGVPGGPEVEADVPGSRSDFRAYSIFNDTTIPQKTSVSVQVYLEKYTR